MDFDDLLTVTVRLFRTCPDVLEDYQERFEHILVDEYQDTNAAQNEIVLLLGARHRNVTVVGDQDQSIYAFRGADMRNIVQFEEAFPDCTTILLEQNYRSTQTILDAANAVIENNVSRKPKVLWTEPAPATRSSATTPTTRATRPSGWPTPWPSSTTGATCGGATWPSSTAPTPRAGWWRKRSCAPGVPYKVVGGTRFYDRREVKDALGLPQGGGEPARRGQRQAGAQRAQAGRGRHHASAASTCGPTATAVTFMDALRPTPTRRGAPDPPARHRQPSWTCSTSSAASCPTGPASRAAGRPRAAAATSTSSRPSTPSSRRGGSRTWASSSGRRASSRPATSSSSRSPWWPTPTSSTATTPRPSS